MPKVYKRRSYKSRKSSKKRRRSPRSSPLSRILLLAGGIFLIICVFEFASGSLFDQTSQQDTAYSIVGSPSISAEFINHILEQYHSPAIDKGQALYDDGLKYSIDPAYALAFFMQESSVGTQGVAKTTHSLGNIRATSGVPQYEGYRYYATWEAGFEDWYKLIANQYVQQWGLKTVDQIIPVYAPSSDHNNEVKYIYTIKYLVDKWRAGIVKP